MKHSAWLLLGGNEGDVALTFNGALVMIAGKVGRIVLKSDIYSSAAWNMAVESMPVENRVFLNMAIEVETELPPLELLDTCKNIEREFGRGIDTNYSAYKSRPLDIDIIFYDSMIYNNPRLFIPHPLVHVRLFVLKPLCEICPDKMHPVLNKTVNDLWGVAGEQTESEKP
jgi:2-amino-4-hydroxy-6-hydroxymethyldihydropteridine diphosphokinase